MTEFDLFLLHDSVRDAAPRSRLICCGARLGVLVQDVLSEIYAKRSRKVISRYFVSRLRVSRITAGRLRRPGKTWFQIVFLKELVDLWSVSCGKSVEESDSLKMAFVERIEFLRVNLSSSQPVRAPKNLSLELCKIAGAHAADGTLADNFFCITDRGRENIVAFQKWVHNTFGFDPPVTRKGKNEWRLSFHNKVFTRYLLVFFGFPSGEKVYAVQEPAAIRKARLSFRQAFALGALTFEAGVGINRDVSFGSASKSFRDAISEIVVLSGLRIKQNDRPNYWRLWSYRLSKEDASKWLAFFEPETEKWFKLYELANSFQGKASSFEEAVFVFDSVFYPGPASKICLKDVLLVISRLKQTHRYELAGELVKFKGLSSFGGKWAHSLRYYLDFLVDAKVVSVSVADFGPKKSFGRIRRHVYSFNPDVSSWRVPYRPWLVASAI